MRAALLASLLAGCAVQPPVVSWERDVDTVVVTVREASDEWMPVLCMGTPREVGSIPAACSARRLTGDGRAACVITVPRPRDFNDQERLALAGHELQHCLGRTHQ